MAIDQSDFTKPIEIFYSDWKESNKWTKINLEKFQTAVEKIIDKTEYYIFTGKILSRNSPHRIENGSRCYFYFAKKSFLEEIKRHYLFFQLDWNTLIDITVEIKRTGKYQLRMRNLEIIQSEVQR